MKVIDLLNKMANGEEVTYRVNEHISKYVEEIKWYLNDEVEIIEPQEHKIPEKITMRADMVGDINNKIENLNINQIAIEDKINEIIDYLKEI